MRVAPFVSALTAVAVLSASMPALTHAQSPAHHPTPLRASIDREGARAAQAPQPATGRTPVRKAMQMGGGGGGGGMMLMTLIVTAASLAGTYFLVKEMRKSTEDTNAAR